VPGWPMIGDLVKVFLEGVDERVWAEIVGAEGGHLKVALRNHPLNPDWKFDDVLTVSFVERYGNNGEGVLILVPTLDALDDRSDEIDDEAEAA
jgi:hypothetical protein